jgi:hypothetical protein
MVISVASTQRTETVKASSPVTRSLRGDPAFGARIWNMVIPGTPSGGPLGSNGIVFHDD